MGKKIVITPGLDNCLFVFTMGQWKKISERLSQSSMLQADSRSFNRFMFGGAVEIDIDSIGRMLIPDFLIERAGLKSRVAVIGVEDRVEIWNEEAWGNYKKVVEEGGGCVGGEAWKGRCALRSYKVKVYNYSMTIHKSVLLNEAINGLNLKPGDIFFDGTLGGGGHSAKVCEIFGKTVRIIGVDRTRKLSKARQKNLKL